jgi:transposase InsO family protein
MPWKELNAMDLRYEFSIRALHEQTPFTELCREYGISRKTGYKWKRRFLAEGRSGLADLSRKPHSSPDGLTEDVVCEIVRLKKDRPAWGPRKIRVLYGKVHPNEVLPSDSSFKRVLERAGLVTKRRNRASRECGRLQNRTVPEKPNDVWTVDFKGYWYTLLKERCEPLTVRDDFSRFVLCASVPANSRTETIRGEFERLFEIYGLPAIIRSDNGPPFSSSNAPLGLSCLSAWWIALGIDLDRIDPGKPYQNGGHERMHRDIAMEVEGCISGDLRNQVAALEVWRQSFNQERPHEAIGMRCPAELYERSPRPYESTPDQLEYPTDYLERRVQPYGAISLEKSKIFISSALRGWNVGLKRTTHGGYVTYFGDLCLGHIDLSTRSFVTE